MLHHGKILKKILIDRDLSQGKFSKAMGLSDTNFKTNFDKQELSKKLIKKISINLNLPESVFDTEGVINYQLAHGNGGDVHQSVGGEAAALREVISAKNEVIASQNKQIALLEALLKEREKK